MTTRAVIITINQASTAGVVGSWKLSYTVNFFHDHDPDGVDTSNLFTIINWTDNASTINNKITTTVVNEAIAKGYTLARTDVFIPSYSKGN